MSRPAIDYIDSFTLQSMRSVGLPEKDINAFGEAQRQKRIEDLNEEIYGVKKSG